MNPKRSASLASQASCCVNGRGCVYYAQKLERKEDPGALDGLESDLCSRGGVFVEPHEDMPRLADLLSRRGAQRLLDLRCGTGRHVLQNRARGFEASGIDSAATALATTQHRQEEAGLAAHLVQGDIFDPLPFADACFDAILSVQMIHHARLAQIAALVEEMARILKAGGLLYVTVPQLQNQGTQFKQIEPGTYIPLDGIEAGLPHHYCLTAVSEKGQEAMPTQPSDPYLFHIASRSQWEDARHREAYRAETFESEGFIHCSTIHQVLPVADAFFRGRQDLVLLLIDSSKVLAPLVYEAGASVGGTSVEETSERYPHLYGPLNREAILNVYDLLPDAHGLFALPQEVLDLYEKDQ